MPTWTKEQLREYQLRQAGAQGLRSAKSEPDSGMPLERVAPREKAGCKCVTRRFRITFTIYRTRPLDYDNHFIKPLQDVLVASGFLPDDDWKHLEGCVRSLKVNKKSDERTEVFIELITHE